MSEEKPILDLPNYYKYDYSKAKIKVLNHSYSNLAWINVSGRDVFIDFLSMPGIIEDGIPVINATRISMPPAAAARLAEVLARTIDQAINDNGFEPISSKKQEKKRK